MRRLMPSMLRSNSVNRMGPCAAATRICTLHFPETLSRTSRTGQACAFTTWAVTPVFLWDSEPGDPPGLPAVALAEFTEWVRDVCAGAQPVMCGYPASQDWTFLYWYLIRFTGESPFGHSGCLDMKTVYATKAGLPLRAVAKGTMPRHLLSRRRHTHHALDDAVEQAELLANLMNWPGPDGSAPVPG